MKSATRPPIVLGAFLLVNISCSSGNSDDAKAPTAETADSSTVSCATQSTTPDVSAGGATSSSDIDTGQELSAPGDTDRGGDVAASDTDGAPCPNVADECPSGCRELVGNPINTSAACMEPDDVVVGCTRNTGSTGDFGCVTRLSDGASFMIGGRSDFNQDLWGECGEEAAAVAVDLSACSE